MQLNFTQAVWVLALVFSASANSNPEATSAEQAQAILPIPLENQLDPEKVALGEMLFHDPALSASGTMACSQCHQITRGGHDSRARAINNDGSEDAMNTPTVFNTRFNFRLTWRGQFRTLEAQAQADLHNPKHANLTWAQLLPILRKNRHYQSRFQQLYKAGLTKNNVLHAIAEFERSLVTINAPIDQYLRGNRAAISAQEKEGFQLFLDYGCVSCHQGVNIGGNLFQKLGLFGSYFQVTNREIKQADFGRFLVTGEEKDRFVFRVPSLRNVAVTGPYFHDGNVPSLHDAVRLMFNLQLGRTASKEEVNLIVKFLHTLTGEYRGKTLATEATFHEAR